MIRSLRLIAVYKGVLRSVIEAGGHKHI
ncbi:hypothetical protein R3I93_018580 [Phoxinus phoxinus]|uniref:Uncharacterized protein n=1 Tax=Phoxinus phoxinus TaxID=58324 RepID=A0AAN9CEW7_9TELE